MTVAWSCLLRHQAEKNNFEGFFKDMAKTSVGEEEKPYLSWSSLQRQTADFL